VMGGIDGRDSCLRATRFSILSLRKWRGLVVSVT